MLRAGVILRRDAAIGLHIFLQTLFGTGESRRELRKIFSRVSHAIRGVN